MQEPLDRSGMAGHPAGLTTLFLTELWERFSYYGMRAILVLYMVTDVVEGGLGFDTKRAASLYGTYTMSVYFTTLPGGFIADKWLGARLSVLLGGIIIACGHFSMIFSSLPFFYLGLILIATGTGLLKPNVSTLVGSLYGKNDGRRDSGFSLFYMGINVGAMLAPLVCGFLAQSETFKNFLITKGLDPNTSWHWGFGAAGIGMTLGLIVFVLQRERLSMVQDRSIRPDAKKGRTQEPADPLTTDEIKRIAAIFIFFLFTMLFWTAYEQKGASLNLFALKLVRTEVFGWKFPSSWLQSLTAMFVIILAPTFSMIWLKLGDRQPSTAAKFTMGLLFIGIGYVIMVPASALTAAGKISPLWLVALYFLEVLGEMCVSPVGLSTVTKLAPLRFVGFMMGVWFLAASLGNKIAGYIGGFFLPESHRLMVMYGSLACMLLVATGILALATPSIRKLMGEVK